MLDIFADSCFVPILQILQTCNLLVAYLSVLNQVIRENWCSQSQRYVWNTAFCRKSLSIDMITHGRSLSIYKGEHKTCLLFYRERKSKNNCSKLLSCKKIFFGSFFHFAPGNVVFRMPTHLGIAQTE